MDQDFEQARVQFEAEMDRKMAELSGKLDSIMLRLRVVKEGLETDIREMKSSSSERWEDLKIKVRDGWSKLSTRLEETIETIESITYSLSGSSR